MRVLFDDIPWLAGLNTNSRNKENHQYTTTHIKFIFLMEKIFYF